LPCIAGHDRRVINEWICEETFKNKVQFGRVTEEGIVPLELRPSGKIHTNTFNDGFLIDALVCEVYHHAMESTPQEEVPWLVLSIEQTKRME